jgi:hypothetical protein
MFNRVIFRTTSPVFKSGRFETRAKPTQVYIASRDPALYAYLPARFLGCQLKPRMHDGSAVKGTWLDDLAQELDLSGWRP